MKKKPGLSRRRRIVLITLGQLSIAVAGLWGLKQSGYPCDLYPIGALFALQVGYVSAVLMVPGILEPAE